MGLSTPYVASYKDFVESLFAIPEVVAHFVKLSALRATGILRSEMEIIGTKAPKTKYDSILDEVIRETYKHD